MDVDNSHLCFTDVQWAYAAAAIALAVLVYIIFPTWLIIKTKVELIFAHNNGE